MSAGTTSTGRWTLRRRLVAVLVGMLVLVTAATAALSTVALRGTLVDQLDEQVLATGLRAAMVRERPGHVGGPPAGHPSGLGAPGQAAGTIGLEVDDGVTAAAYLDAQGDYQALTTAQQATLAAVAPDSRPRTVPVDGLGTFRVVARTTPDGALVVTGLSLDPTLATVERYLVAELLIAAVGILLAALAGRTLVRRELRPLERVAATATRVSTLPLHRGEVGALDRVPDADTDPTTEVGQVGAALNRLLGHVEDALAARHRSETQVRHFVADASHELRTPLASIRGYAELVRHVRADLPPDVVHAMGRVEQEARRMTTLVEDLLLLARLDAGRPLARADVDLVALAVDAVADAHVAGPDHVWHLDLPLDDEDVVPAVVTGDEDRLRQVLVNLLANARVHTPAGTTVRTTVRPVPDAQAVCVEVRDDGPGIPADVRPRLFQRFARGDTARTPGEGSSGLGLAIVAAVVAAHGGRIDVGGPPGTVVTVTLPVTGGPDPA